MLVLTRKLMERLFIGDDICVTVVRLESGQVRLGIDAPREVAVVRAELVPDRSTPGPHHGRDGGHSPARGAFRPSPYEARGNGSRPRGRSR
jgi:carbon storage regulator